MLGWEIAAVLACIALSAFFSASETALTALGPVKTQKIIESGGFWNKSLVLWRDKPLKVLTCILIGNNIVNITGSTLAADLAQRYLGQTAYADTAIPIVIGIMTFLVLTFGEITPKSIARAQAKRLGGVLMWFMRGPYYAFYPFTVFFALLTRLIVRTTGDKLDSSNQVNVTEEDIEYLVELGSRHGSLESDKEKILQSVFEYTETSVREIMVPRIEIKAIEKTWDLNRVLGVLVDSGHSRVPVYEETIDNIVGLFYAKDLLRVMQHQSRDDFQLGGRFLRQVDFVPEQMKISALLTKFRKNRVHIAIVVDEFGGTSGLITLEDIIEEFFGEIQDEYDSEESYLKELNDGSLLAAARCPLDVLEDHLDVEFPEDGDYESLGGFVASITGAMPKVGDEVSHGGLLIRVTKADARHVIEVSITRQPTLEDPDDVPSRPAA